MAQDWEVWQILARLTSWAIYAYQERLGRSCRSTLSLVFTAPDDAICDLNQVDVLVQDGI
jgi:hypothetical protein